MISQSLVHTVDNEIINNILKKAVPTLDNKTYFKPSVGFRFLGYSGNYLSNNLFKNYEVTVVPNDKTAYMVEMDMVGNRKDHKSRINYKKDQEMWSFPEGDSIKFGIATDQGIKINLTTDPRLNLITQTEYMIH